MYSAKGRPCVENTEFYLVQSMRFRFSNQATYFLGLIDAKLLAILCTAGCFVVFPGSLCAQSRKPTRAKPPLLNNEDFADVFVNDPKSRLQGEMPSSQAVLAMQANASSANDSANAKPSTDASNPLNWNKLIAPTSIEDLVKGSKLASRSSCEESCSVQRRWISGSST